MERLGPLAFVVQLHRARRLHYDLRLEVEGVLISWAIPKGPSLDPSDKRLAVAVEDHPFEYGTFEGVIPAGEYGGGEVIVWDAGTYSPAHEHAHSWLDAREASTRMRSDLESGRVVIYLRGQKLKGRFSLIRTEQGWLFTKSRDGLEGRTVDELSVLTGRRVEEVTGPPLGPSSWPVPQLAAGSRPRPLPSLVQPMLAQSARQPFHDPAFVFEPKLDGVRLLVRLQQGSVGLWSRQGRDHSDQYPELSQALTTLPVAEAWLDGEVVAPDEQGRPSFERLQGRINLERPADIARAEREIPVVFYPFDLLHLDGFELIACPLEQRQRLLETVLVPPFQPVARFQDGLAAFQAMTNLGMEGLMAKRRGSRYEPGRRSASWLKVKSTREEVFVVVGFRPGEGSRADTFGSLVLGSRGEDGRLRYVGDVGSGFDEAGLAQWHQRLQALRGRESALVDPPRDGPITWVEPSLRVEVRYQDRTSQGKLRAPVFLGLAENETLERLRVMGAQGTLEVEGHQLALTNLDKPLWPDYTKRDLIAYVLSVGSSALPHLLDRPITLTRYPDGIQGKSFYQKHWTRSELPEFVETAENREDPREPWLLCHNLATMVWLAQLANLELHAWLSRASPLEDRDDPLLFPDRLLFDLDPFIDSGREAEGAEPELSQAGFRNACSLARDLREMLLGIGLTPFVKTSGKTGLHVMVPLVRRYPFEAVRAACRTLAQFLARKRPQEVTLEWSTARRAGKVFVDVNQNSYGKSLAWIYSPRPVSWAGVSVPLAWDELDSVYPAEFTLASAPARVVARGDLWRDMNSAAAELAQ